ncbi:hypothetical protein DL93DRAFT_1358327 [Clavulina sp. PMI_390]|nr:hypothetical protein DL93DRAFT_1358327 [Clavulina sp. PMI_390]
MTPVSTAHNKAPNDKKTSDSKPTSSRPDDVASIDQTFDTAMVTLPPSGLATSQQAVSSLGASSLKDIAMGAKFVANEFSGKVHFRTTDLKDIVADSIIFERASPLFGGPQPIHLRSDSAPIQLRCNSRALHALLDLLYPTDQRPDIASVSELTEILLLVNDLEISCYSVRETLNSRIGLESHPLCSWALATAFDYPDAQRAATKRYFQSDPAVLDELPDELCLVDAWQMMQLSESRKRAIKAARDAILRVDLKCVSCHGDINLSTAGSTEPYTTPQQKFTSKVCFIMFYTFIHYDP